MSFRYEYWVQDIAVERMQSCLREAEMRCRLRRAGVMRPGWLSRHGCRLLLCLGHLLIALGRWLEQHAVSPILSPDSRPQAS